MSQSAKGRIISKEQRKKISNTLKGKYCGENHPFYGKSHSKEFKEKLSKVYSGRSLSEKTKKRMSESHKGKIPWNKGKKLSKETREKMSKSQKGRLTWNKNKKLSEEHKNNISQPLKGHKVSDETKEKISRAQSGSKAYMYGREPTNKIKFTEKQIEDILIRIIKKENLNDIAKDYNCSASTIKNRKHQNKKLFLKLKDNLN